MDPRWTPTQSDHTNPFSSTPSLRNDDHRGAKLETSLRRLKALRGLADGGLIPAKKGSGEACVHALMIAYELGDGTTPATPTYGGGAGTATDGGAAGGTADVLLHHTTAMLDAQRGGDRKSKPEEEQFRLRATALAANPESLERYRSLGAACATAGSTPDAFMKEVKGAQIDDTLIAQLVHSANMNIPQGVLLPGSNLGEVLQITRKVGAALVTAAAATVRGRLPDGVDVDALAKCVLYANFDGFQLKDYSEPKKSASIVDGAAEPKAKAGGVWAVHHGLAVVMPVFVELVRELHPYDSAVERTLLKLVSHTVREVKEPETTSRGVLSVLGEALRTLDRRFRQFDIGADLPLLSKIVEGDDMKRRVTDFLSSTGCDAHFRRREQVCRRQGKKERCEHGPADARGVKRRSRRAARRSLGQGFFRAASGHVSGVQNCRPRT